VWGRVEEEEKEGERYVCAQEGVFAWCVLASISLGLVRVDVLCVGHSK